MQLLRTLDLNSPSIEGQGLPPNKLDFDLSPSTSSSFPNTPLETSPTASCVPPDAFHSFSDYASSNAPTGETSRTIQCAHASGDKFPGNERIWTGTSHQNPVNQPQHNQAPHLYLDNAPDMHLYAPQASVVHDLRRIPSAPWRSHSATPGEWARPMHPLLNRMSSNFPGEPELNRVPFGNGERFTQSDSTDSSRVSVSPPRQPMTNEVRVVIISCLIMLTMTQAN